MTPATRKDAHHRRHIGADQDDTLTDSRDTPTQASDAPGQKPPAERIPIWERPSTVTPGPMGLAWWGWFLVAGVVASFALHPLDARVDALLHSSAIGGDVRRELYALQQYGQASCIVIVAIIIALLDRARVARLLDYGMALAVLGLVTFGAKMLIGRPRPQIGDVDRFLGPFGSYPMVLKDGQKVMARSWDLSFPDHSQLWSMPSSHTAFAVAMSVFLASMYPRLKSLVIVLACIVMFGRLIFDAHWLTDLVVGAALAGAVTHPIIHAKLGQRLIARLGFPGRGLV
ncbi:MAG: phosphatase PAP2 family protein [Phycisphaerales bacterium]|nr:phosphatase PAP2 family protein [Phycisphaerales bacterium]